MSSVSRPNGFAPVKHVTGAPYNGQTNVYFVPSTDGTAIFVGDLVKLAGAARDPSGVPTVARAGATDAVIGVVVGMMFSGIGDVQNVPPVTSLDLPIYRAASTNRYLLVADSPDLIFEAQTSAALTAADVGLNASPTTTAGSTTTGTSAEVVDMATVNTTATLPLKIVGWPQRPDNNLTDTYTKAYVMINNHQLKGGTGTAGV
jgi:hypothetical protein